VRGAAGRGRVRSALTASSHRSARTAETSCVPVSTSKQTSLEETPLHAAARHAHNAEIIIVLVDAGAEIEARDRNQRTALHEAVFMDNLITARVLLQHGASRSAIDAFGETPAGDLSTSSPEELVALLHAGAT
jgi:ankyrin repeat protein